MMNLADLDPPQNERQQSGNKFFQFSIGGEKMKMIGSCMILYSLLAINGYFQVSKLFSIELTVFILLTVILSSDFCSFLNVHNSISK